MSNNWSDNTQPNDDEQRTLMVKPPEEPLEGNELRGNRAAFEDDYQIYRDSTIGSVIFMIP